jgi:hypothetical protein
VVVLDVDAEVGVPSFRRKFETDVTILRRIATNCISEHGKDTRRLSVHTTIHRGATYLHLRHIVFSPFSFLKNALISWAVVLKRDRFTVDAEDETSAGVQGGANEGDCVVAAGNDAKSLTVFVGLAEVAVLEVLAVVWEGET